MYLHLHVVYLLYAAVVGNVLFTNTWAQKMLNFSFFKLSDADFVEG